MDGVCQVKAEYIVPKSEPKPTATTESTCLDNNKESTAAANGNNMEKNENGNDEPAQKKQRLSNREYKKMKKGQNKSRPRAFTMRKFDNLCMAFYDGPSECKQCDFVDAPLLPEDQQRQPPQPRRRAVIRAPALIHAQLPRRQFAYINGRRVMPSIREAALESLVRNLRKTVADLKKTVADLQNKLEKCVCQAA